MSKQLAVGAVLLVLLSGCGGDAAQDAGNDGVEASSAEPASSAEAQTQVYGDKPHAIPGRIEAEDFDEGPAGVAYHDVEPENLGADYRGPTGVDIEQRDDASGGHGLGWTRTGEWVVYTVDIQEAGPYEIEIPVASNKQGGVMHLEIDGEDVTGPIEVPDTGGWDRLQTIRATTSPLRQGQARLTIKMDRQGESGSIGDIDYLEFSNRAAAD